MTCLEFDPAGKRLAAAGREVRVWNLDTKKQPDTFAARDVVDMRFVGNALLTVGDDTHELQRRDLQARTTQKISLTGPDQARDHHHPRPRVLPLPLPSRRTGDQARRQCHGVLP